MHDEFDGFSIHLLQDDEGDFTVSACGSTAEEALFELKRPLLKLHKL